MIIAHIGEDQRVLNLFDTDKTVDEGVQGVEVPHDVYIAIWESSLFGDWKYENGDFILDPLPRLEPQEITATLPSGQIPQSVL